LAKDNIGAKESFGYWRWIDFSFSGPKPENLWGRKNPCSRQDGEKNQIFIFNGNFQFGYKAGIYLLN